MSVAAAIWRGLKSVHTQPDDPAMELVELLTDAAISRDMDVDTLQSLSKTKAIDDAELLDELATCLEDLVDAWRTQELRKAHEDGAPPPGVPV